MKRSESAEAITVFLNRDLKLCREKMKQNRRECMFIFNTEELTQVVEEVS